MTEEEYEYMKTQLAEKEARINELENGIDAMISFIQDVDSYADRAFDMGKSLQK